MDGSRVPVVEPLRAENVDENHALIDDPVSVDDGSTSDPALRGVLLVAGRSEVGRGREGPPTCLRYQQRWLVAWSIR